MGESLGTYFFRDAMEISIEIHIFRHREIFIKAEFLRHIAEFRLKRRRFSYHIVPENGKGSSGRRHKAANETHERRFPGAVGPDESGNAAGAHGEGDRRKGENRCFPRQGKFFREGRRSDDGVVFLLHIKAPP